MVKCEAASHLCPPLIYKGKLLALNRLFQCFFDIGNIHLASGKNVTKTGTGTIQINYGLAAWHVGTYSTKAGWSSDDQPDISLMSQFTKDLTLARPATSAQRLERQPRSCRQSRSMGCTVKGGTGLQSPKVREIPECKARSQLRDHQELLLLQSQSHGHDLTPTT